MARSTECEATFCTGPLQNASKPYTVEALPRRGPLVLDSKQMEALTNSVIHSLSDGVVLPLFSYIYSLVFAVLSSNAALANK